MMENYISWHPTLDRRAGGKGWRGATITRWTRRRRPDRSVDCRAARLRSGRQARRRATRGVSNTGSGHSSMPAAATCCSSPARSPSIRVDGRVAACRRRARRRRGCGGSRAAGAAAARATGYRETRIADGSFRVAGLGRFRINLHRERGRAAAAVRALPARVPRLPTLNLPPTVELLTQLPRGLVLVGGPTGSGKTTTLAALVDEINRRRRATSSPSKIRSNTSTLIIAASSSRSKSESTRRTFRPRCARRCARRRTSSSSARCAIPRPCGSRWPRRRPATSSLDRAHERCRVDRRSDRRLVSAPSVRTPSGRSWRWRLPRS